MKTILLYLLQVIICSGILYSYYHFFLRNKKFHQYNRFYLLAITLISLIIPFLDIPVYFSSQQDIPVVYQLLSEVRVGNNEKLSSPSQFFNWTVLAQLLYWLIAALILIRFCMALFKLRSILIKYKAEEMNNISFVNTNEEGTPYSFFHWLFWNKTISLGSANGQQIFRHEMFHIQQKHSWDIVFTELLTVIFWINPFFHLIKKELKTIHEFLADQFAAGHDNNWEYAELLVMQVLQTRQRLVNPFFHNQIKRRIAMITNSSKTRYQYLRKLMVFPVASLTMVLVAINCRSKNDLIPKKPEVEIKEVRLHDINATVSNNKQDDTKTGNVKIVEVKLEDIKKDLQTGNDRVYQKVEIEAAFPGGQSEWIKYLQKNLNPVTPVDNGAPEGAYTVMTQFIVDENGNISDLKALTKHGYGMEEEVLRLMTKGPRWESAIQNGKKVKAYRKQPVTFQIQGE